MRALERVLALLPNARKTGDGWVDRCPAHEDRKPSLCINEGDDGRVLIHCQAGCTIDAVCQALGLKKSDLFDPSTRSTSTMPRNATPKKGGNGKAFPTAEAAIRALECKLGPRSTDWTYRDAAGEPVGLVVRWDQPDGGKEIRPVSRYPDGWRIEGMPEPRPLYGLPELADATTVYLVEGEKAADAARKLGLVATTSPHGANAAAKADWTPLANKLVVRLADNDAPGRRYVGEATAMMAGVSPAPVVKDVELPGLPRGGDIVDYIAAHPGVDPAELRGRIEALAAAAEPVTCEKAPSPATPCEESPRQADHEPALDEPALDEPPWPDPIDPAAYHGVLGRIVRAIDPHSEADPVAILLQLLVGFGNAIGRTAYFVAEADRHYCNLFIGAVGATSKGRKGSSWSQARGPLASIDTEWADTRILNGLSSGEGLIWAVRDPIVKKEPVREEGKAGRKGKIVGYEEVVIDEGEADKRLLVLETELGGTLRVLAREKNTLSAIIRQAWDSGRLRTLTKNSPAKATDAHISIIGHVTRDELRRHLAETDIAGGLANRFLWPCVRRSKCLPEGGQLHTVDFREMMATLQTAAAFARQAGEVTRDDDARAIWREIYAELSQGQPGLLGAVLGRAEAQVMRLAMLYALLDGTNIVGRPHMEAALAVWEYCEASAKHIFGDKLGDPTADEILAVLRSRPEGMTRTEMRDHFGRHKSADEIVRALRVLLRGGLARMLKVETGGRQAERWFAN